jgi:hypothetical protein
MALYRPLRSLWTRCTKYNTFRVDPRVRMFAAKMSFLFRLAKCQGPKEAAITSPTFRFFASTHLHGRVVRAARRRRGRVC